MNGKKMRDEGKEAGWLAVSLSCQSMGNEHE
jgi:hypothetical protein